MTLYYFPIRQSEISSEMYMLVYVTIFLLTGLIPVSGDWFEPRFFKNPEDRFCRVEAHFILG